MYEIDDDDGRTGHEQSPSCGTFETAEVMHAEDAHTTSEYHDPEEGDGAIIRTMLRDSSATLEVAL